MAVDITVTLSNSQAATRQRRKQLTAQLAKIETQEGNLIDLAADGLSSASKIRRRLAELDEQKKRIERDLAPVEADLSAGAAYLRATVRLLHNIGALYQRVNDLDRRLLNHAIFDRFYIDERGSSGVLKPPFAELSALDQRAAPVPEKQHTPSFRRTCDRLLADTRGSLADLLNQVLYDRGSGKAAMVEVRGIEPLASTVR